MITIANKKFQVASPNVDATQIIWTLTASASTVTFSENTGIIYDSSGDIIVDVYYANEAAFGTETITLTVEDDLGCDKTQTFSLNNPCANLSVSISESGVVGNPFSFIAVPVGGGGGYTYKWYYDTNIFSSDSDTSQELNLSVRPGKEVPDGINVSVDVTSTAGCVRTANYNYTLCRPEITIGDVFLACVKEPVSSPCGNVVSQAYVRIESEACTNREIDWSTLSIQTDSIYACTEPLLDINGNPIAGFILYVTDSILRNLNIQATVKDNQGVQSLNTGIGVTAPSCPFTPNTPQIPVEMTHVLTSNQMIPTVVSEFDIEFYIPEADRPFIDWGTFTFIASTGQATVTATELTATNGTATFDMDRKILYKWTAKVENVDIIHFRVFDVEGTVMHSVRVYLDTESHIAPSAVADSYDVVAGVPTELFILANDGGGWPVDPTSISINIAPTKGNVITAPQGTITYTGDFDKSGADSVWYTVDSPEGATSASTQVTINIVNAGQDGSFSLCDSSSTVDFENIISNNGAISVTAGGSWSADAGNPDLTVSLASPTAVDFAGKAEGIYTFYYDVSSGFAVDQSVVTINFNPIGFKTVTKTSAVFTFPATTDPNEGTFNFAISGFSNSTEVVAKLYFEASPAVLPLAGDPAKFLAVLTPDAFDIGAGTMSFVYSNCVVGYSYQLQIEYTDSCGNPQTEDSSILITV